MISLELNLIPNQPVLIGVSGGIDSVCLLDLLQKKIEKKWIIVLHLNHQLRKEANSDEKFVCKLAEQYQIKVEIKKSRCSAFNSEFFQRLRTSRQRTTTFIFFSNARKISSTSLIIGTSCR